MVRLKLFTASIVLLYACGNDSKPLPGESGSETAKEDELPPISIKDSTLEHKIIGTWLLTVSNNQSVDARHELTGLKQAYLADHTWLISRETADTSVLVGGGRWFYDANSQQISTFFLPDSIANTVVLTEINVEKMTVETHSGNQQTWSRIKTDTIDEKVLEKLKR